jgi:ribulose-5-phosphate 4-epimerase/fuculose-1-phosphate aldolase
VGDTVDEAVYLFGALDRMCQAQLAVEAACANGLTKKTIGEEEAAFTAATIAYPENVWANFQAEFGLLVQERGHIFLK